MEITKTLGVQDGAHSSSNSALSSSTGQGFEDEVPDALIQKVTLLNSVVPNACF